MAASDDFSDDIVAELLRKDAKAKNKEYAMVGLSAYRPSVSRPPAHAPKPNTRFLKHIIREVDGHNQALKDKEEVEARARLRALRGAEGRARDAPRGERKLYEPPSKRRKVDGHAVPERHEEPPASSRRDRDGTRAEGERRRESERSGRRSRRDAESSGEERHVRTSRRHKSHKHRDSDRREASSRSPQRRHDESEYQRRKHRRGASESASLHERSRSRSRSPVRERKRDRERSPSGHKERKEHHRHRSSRSRERRRRRRQERSPDGGSDPLEAIVGPIPPPQPVKRGRGTHGASSAMDARFADSYDPAADVQPEGALSDKDDWGLAVEAYRDRAKWKALGAERLRSAGFSEAEVKKWEDSGREKGEEDVTWAKQGEGREWDRGKVVTDDGDVELKASWADAS